MNNTTLPQHLTSRNVTKIFSVVTTYRECGVVSSVDHDVIELHADAQGFMTAQLNGQQIGYALATSILNHADSTRLVHETRPTPVVAADVAAPIGNPAARLLHIELGRLGYRTSASHYEAASVALGREVTSLASLTAAEAVLTRSFAYGQLSLETGTVAA